MAVTLTELQEGRILEVVATDKLGVEDYKRFVPEFERLSANHGKINVLFNMKGFHGWGLGALWEDLKFDVKHFKDIDRLAMVGEKRWEAAMSDFCRPFTTAKIRYFDRSEEDEAHAWIAGDRHDPAPSG